MLVIRAKAGTPHTVFDTLKEEACFYYVMDGRSELHMPTKKIDIPSKQGVSLQCGNYIGKFFSEQDRTEAEILIIKFKKNILKQIYKEDTPPLFAKTRRNKEKHCKHITNSTLLEDYVRGLLFYIDNPQLAVEELLVMKIKELFILLANTDDSNIIHQLIDNLFSDVDFNFRQVIEQNYYSDLKLEELAHLCMMSLSTFKRKFKEEFKVSPHQLFLQKKLEKAKKLIINSSLTLSQISVECGFSEYSNFSAAFKKKYELSPRKFKYSSSSCT